MLRKHTQDMTPYEKDHAAQVKRAESDWLHVKTTGTAPPNRNWPNLRLIPGPVPASICTDLNLPAPGSWGEVYDAMVRGIAGKPMRAPTKQTDAEIQEAARESGAEHRVGAMRREEQAGRPETHWDFYRREASKLMAPPEDIIPEEVAAAAEKATLQEYVLPADARSTGAVKAVR